MINILNFAAVPFNSPVYERTEKGKQALREEVMMEVARELQDLESDVSRILSRDSPFEAIPDLQVSNWSQEKRLDLPAGSWCPGGI